jgi:tripartite-type tricarboxylate transporter receptor subunit TctC
MALVGAACGDDDTGGGDAAGDSCNGFPSQAIEFIVPYSAGGGFDSWARLVAPFVGDELGVDIGVVNVQGGGGLVGATQLYGTDPDGYTIMIGEPGSMATGQLLGDAEFDLKEFTGIAQVTVAPEVLAVAGDSMYTGYEDLAGAEGLKQASGGIAAIEVVTYDALGIPFDPIVHEGSSEAILSVIRGDTAMAIFPLTSMVEQFESGDLRPVLVIGTPPPAGKLGADLIAGVPTIDEATGQDGLGAALEQHRVVIGPPGMEDCVTQILSDAFVSVLTGDEFVTAATEAGRDPVPEDAATTQEIMGVTFDSLSQYIDLIRESVTE